MIIDSTFKCTQETFNKATSRSLILLTCIECDKDYMRIKKEILNTFTKYGTKPKFCSKSCLGKNKKKSIETSCNNCNKTINKSSVFLTELFCRSDLFIFTRKIFKNTNKYACRYIESMIFF